MAVLKLGKLVLLLIFLLQCTGYVPPASYPANNNPRSGNPYPNSNFYNPPYQQQNLSSINVPRDDSEYTRRRATDPDRDSTLSRAKKGDSCEYEKSSHECYDLCKKMYKRSDDRKECLELTPDNIETIYEVFKALESGRLSHLEGIDVEPFDWFINVSIAGFDFLIRREYKRSEAEDVLIWISENEEVAEVMRDEDDDFETLEELLSLVDRFELETVEEPFIKLIDRHTLLEYAINAGNDIAIDYFLDYFFQTHRSCRNNKKITIACLTVICKIGASIDERDRENIFDSSIFADFIEDIIKEKINGADSASGEKWIKGTGDKKIDSLNDLDDSWADNVWDPDNGKRPLCGGLIPD